MKSFITLVGILLIILGIVAFAYQGLSYTQRENVAQIGNLKITADTEKTVYIPPLLSGIVLVAGLVLVVIGRKSK